MKQENMRIVSQRQLAPHIFELVLEGKLVEQMKFPGQFIHILAPRADLLLRRPISLAKIDQATSNCTIIYRVEGDGTRALSKLGRGETVDVMGPLGHGFPIDNLTSGQTALIIGGGIGVPPLYELSCQLVAQGVRVIHVLGFATADVCFYEHEFRQNGQTIITTDDGSAGVCGHVGTGIDLKVVNEKVDAVFACGSTGLLKTVEEKYKNHPHAYYSLEERMACGMGACYACVCHVSGDESQTESKRICQDGPVFAVGEVNI